MKKTVNWYIKENNKKRGLLTKENEQFYSNVLTYIRASLFKDTLKTEEVLYELLNHMIDAQNEGKTAEDVFGKNPKELADEVLENIPNEPLKFQLLFGAEILLTLIGVYTAITGAFNIFSEKQLILYSGNVAIMLCLFVLGIVGVVTVAFTLLKKESFQSKKMSIYTLLFVLVFVVFSIAIALVATKLPHYGNPIELGKYGLFGIGCVLLLVAYILKKIREQR